MSDGPAPEAEEAPAAPAPKPRKKKRRKKPARADGPAFAREFPREPELERLVAAFDAGDYASVRSGAPRLAKSTDDDAVRRAARELARRIEPDPMAKWMMAGAAALLAFLALWYWSHPHEPPNAASPPGTQPSAPQTPPGGP